MNRNNNNNNNKIDDTEESCPCPLFQAREAFPKLYLHLTNASHHPLGSDLKTEVQGRWAFVIFRTLGADLWTAGRCPSNCCG